VAVPSLFLDPAAGGAMGPKIIVDGVESSALEVPLTSIRKFREQESIFCGVRKTWTGRVEVLTRKGSLATIMVLSHS